MAKLTLNDVTNIDGLSVINDNFDKIEQELQNKVLYRVNPVGEPNTISQDIDMNGNDLLNVGDVVSVYGRWATIDEVEAIKDQVEVDAATVAADKAAVLGYRNTAQVAAADAQTAYDNFDDRYLGSKISDPSVDNDGGALLTGALYYNTSGTPIMLVYNGTTWQDVGSITSTTTNLIDSALYSSQAEAEAGVNNTKIITPLSAKQAIDKQVKEGFTSTGPIVLPGNATTSLQATPKQQVEALALSAVESYRGTDLRISELAETSLYDNNYSSMIVKMSDGRLVGWGRGSARHLGTGNQDDSSIRPSFSQFAPAIPAGVTIDGFVVGSADSFAWLSNGWVYHAGANARGVGGHGDTVIRPMFTRINFFFSGGLSVIDVKPGSHRPDDQYSIARFLCSNGDVYFTGFSGGQGAAGDGSLADRNISTPVKCLVSSIVGINLGSDNDTGSFAWRSDGSCYAWGGNWQGSLGIGTTSGVATPTLVSGLSVDKVVNRVAINGYNQRIACTLFLLKDGTVKAAGYNNGGQLGDGTTIDRVTPVTVTGLSNIIDVGIGGGDLSYCWAITSANRLKVWGWNSYGVLGVGDTVNRSTPLDPIGWIDESGVQTTSGDPPFQGKIVKVITAKTFAGGPSNIGRPEMVVLDEDGGVWCAGENRTLAAGPIAADTNLRFKRASLGAVAPNDKIVDIHMQGNSANGADIRLFALTQQGKLLMSGTNNWDLGTAMPGTSSSSYRAVFLQPVRLGV